MRGPDASLALATLKKNANWRLSAAIAEKHATRSSRHKALLLNDTMVVGAAQTAGW
jgi:hypothetical protein